jgi:ribosomal protein S27AE
MIGAELSEIVESALKRLAMPPKEPKCSDCGRSRVPLTRAGERHVCGKCDATWQATYQDDCGMAMALEALHGLACR